MIVAFAVPASANIVFYMFGERDLLKKITMNGLVIPQVLQVPIARTRRGKSIAQRLRSPDVRIDKHKDKADRHRGRAIRPRGPSFSPLSLYTAIINRPAICRSILTKRAEY